MPYWEVIANGDVVAPQVFMKHVVHVFEGIGNTLIVGKLPDDDTFHVRHQAAHLDIMQHAVNLGHTLTGILHEKDDFRQCQRVVFRFRTSR